MLLITTDVMHAGNRSGPVQHKILSALNPTYPTCLKCPASLQRFDQPIRHGPCQASYGASGRDPESARTTVRSS